MFTNLSRGKESWSVGIKGFVETEFSGKLNCKHDSTIIICECVADLLLIEKKKLTT